MKMTHDDRFVFIVEQYRAMRAESAQKMGQDRQVQRNGVITLSALYSFLTAFESSLTDERFLYFLPPLVAIFVYFQQRRIKVHSDRIGEFCLRLEREVFDRDDMREMLGWEHFLHFRSLHEAGKLKPTVEEIIAGDAEINSARLKRTSSTNYLEDRFWIFTAIGTFTFAVYQFFCIDKITVPIVF